MNVQLFDHNAKARTAEDFQEELRCVCRRLRWDYTDTTDTKVFHLVYLGCGGWLAVIGDGGNASYEWIARDPRSFVGDSAAEYTSQTRAGAAAFPHFATD